MSFDASQPAHVAFRNLVAERTSPIVAWVGSGLSAAAGLPTWSQLKSALFQAWEKKAASLHPGERDREKSALKTASVESNYWVAFELLQRGLGNTTFRDVIREQFREAPRVPVPQTYRELWRLRLSGLLNLNLDRLATRAFVETNPSAAPLEYNGFDVANVLGILKNPRPFLVNLHGHSEDTSTWVLTKPQLVALTKSRGYGEFLRTCLATRTVLFLGIGADDVAVGGHVEALARLTGDMGTHYWVTDRRDSETDRWAERNQIRVIRYEAGDGAHPQLDGFFRDLGSYLPIDEVPPPVVLSAEVKISEEMESPRDLARQEADAIRKQLNSRAMAILKPGTPEAYAEFDQFCKRYDEAIYRAWYTALDPPGNLVLDYTLEERVGRGAFGTVYRVRTPSGEPAALKLLNHDIRAQPDMLQSFRRGVRSMRILHEAKVEGMVPFRDASEIPTFVVMDWVEGPNLREAVFARQLEDWQSRLRVALSLTQILRRAHALPQRVLHRDLRPSNVMLRNFYADPDKYDVVVLDFDLSWHIGSLEKTAMIGADTTGYLAPEQLQRVAGVSTRHAAVDSFGLGMTLYLLVSGRDPFPTEHNHAEWRNTVRNAAHIVNCSEWVSLPERFSRLIVQCTRDAQNERWDMSQVEIEIARLNDALAHPDVVSSAELLAEELISRTGYRRSYRWDEDRLFAEVGLPSGLALRAIGDERGAKVIVAIDWMSSGEYSRKRVMKWLPSAGDRVRKALVSGGWVVGSEARWGEQIHFDAAMHVDQVARSTDGAAAALEAAMNELRFE
jgi:serine/threonine protein kinase